MFGKPPYIVGYTLVLNLTAKQKVSSPNEDIIGDTIGKPINYLYDKYLSHET